MARRMGRLAPAAPSVHPAALLLPFALAVAANGCRSSDPIGKDPRSLYEGLLRDLSPESGGGLRVEDLERQSERCEKIHAWHAEGRLETAEDFYFASAVLVESDVAPDLELAFTLASRAAELGDERAWTLVAYSTDKQLVDRGAEHQLYGTVIVYEPVLERFALYPVDPTTTDVERGAMGVPPLAQLLAEVEDLNRTTFAERLRDAPTVEGEPPPGGGERP